MGNELNRYIILQNDVLYDLGGITVKFTVTVEHGYQPRKGIYAEISDGETTNVLSTLMDNIYYSALTIEDLLYDLDSCDHLKDFRFDAYMGKITNEIELTEDGYYIDDDRNEYPLSDLKVMYVLRNGFKYKIADKDDCGLWRVVMPEDQFTTEGASA